MTKSLWVIDGIRAELTRFHGLLLIFLFLMPAHSVLAKVSDQGVSIERDWRTVLARPPGREMYRWPHAECFRKAAEKTGIRIDVLVALGRAESDFKPRAISSAEAVGVMQILWPATANELGIYRKSQLMDPCTNIDAGARYFRKLMDRYKGNTYYSLAAYNYGPGRIHAGARPDQIPNGAQWYAGYVLDHFKYVSGKTGTKGRYQSTRSEVLLAFSKPWRARGFMQHIEVVTECGCLELFRASADRYEVLMRYDSASMRARQRTMLKKGGLHLD